MRVVEHFGRGRNTLRQGHEKDHRRVRVAGQHLELATGSVSELVATKQGREILTTYCRTSHRASHFSSPLIHVRYKQCHGSMILELQQLSIVPFLITYSMSSQLSTCTFMWVNTDKDRVSRLEE
jgi:hypothetical protein